MLTPSQSRELRDIPVIDVRADWLRLTSPLLLDLSNKAGCFECSYCDMCMMTPRVGCQLKVTG